MDSIKKKMQSLGNETAHATARAERWEKEVANINATADASEEQVKNLQRKIQQTESAFDVCTEDLFNQTIKLEEMEKKAGNAEGQVGDLARRLLLLEEAAVKSEERLGIAATNLAKTSIYADKSIKDQHDIGEVCAKKSENNDSLETQLKDAQYTLTESENKYETLARKLNTVEAEAVRSSDRAENIETKFVDIEDELKVVGQKQQTLEVSEEKNLEGEDILLKQIKELMNKLVTADTRSENAEMDIGRLNVRIDKVEEDLVTEKSKIKRVSDDLNAVFEDLM
jgi:chromosome segregation ATPase